MYSSLSFLTLGCACGKHIDPPYDPSSSSTAQIERCFGGGKCYIKQAYSEGSSWHAYKVKDRVWVGGDKLPYPLTFSSAIPFLRNGNAVNEDDRSKEDKEREQRLSAYINSVSTTFNFGCQDKETGLFRSQQIDGIMGKLPSSSSSSTDGDDGDDGDDDVLTWPCLRSLFTHVLTIFSLLPLHSNDRHVCQA